MPSASVRLDRAKDAIDNNLEKANPTPESLQEKFTRLRDEWKAKRGHESSSTRLAMHPAYQKIIGMGTAVVPLLLRELENGPDSWFWALHSITEADSVPEEDCGDGEAMARAWLEWGKKQGIQW